jgi:hypothetical protein
MTEARLERSQVINSPEAIQRKVPVIELYPEQKKVRILDVSLDVLPLPENVSAQRFIPKWEQLKNSTCWDIPTVTLVRDMAVRLNGGISSRNEGPTGVSKSFAAEVICSLTNRSYLRHNYSKNSDIGDTIGRFVPQDEKISVRFEELLSDQNLKKESREIIEKAFAESRPLSIYESKRIASIEKLDGLTETTPWKWKNGTLAGSMMYDTVFGADEVNLAPGNVVERENPAVERRPSLRIVEHEGEIIRDLTPEEQTILDSGGVIPGVIGLTKNFWYVAAQNPFGIGGGRIEESEARRNRLQDRIVGSLKQKDYEDYLRFLIKGEQPDIVWNGKRFSGEKNIQTGFRDLEAIPNIDVLIPWIAEFQIDLASLAEKGKIGSEKDIKGGSYVYTRRNMLRFLDSVKAARASLVNIPELFTTGNAIPNDSWCDLVMEGVYQEYLSGLYEEDRVIIEKLIEQSGIKERLGSSINNPKPPAWVERARKKKINVEEGNGKWLISKFDLLSMNIKAEDVLEGLYEDYTFIENGDTMTAIRSVRSIAGVYSSLSPEERGEVTSATFEQIFPMPKEETL